MKLIVDSVSKVFDTSVIEKVISYLRSTEPGPTERQDLQPLLMTRGLRSSIIQE